MNSKVKFSKEEDVLLVLKVKEAGKAVNWSLISLDFDHKTPRQLRDRYNYHLKSELKKGSWTEEEDKIIYEQYKILGPKWKLISTFVSGRTAYDTRNRILSLEKKKKNSNKETGLIQRVNTREKRDETLTSSVSNDSFSIFDSLCKDDLDFIPL